MICLFFNWEGPDSDERMASLSCTYEENMLVGRDWKKRTVKMVPICAWCGPFVRRGPHFIVRVTMGYTVELFGQIPATQVCTIMKRRARLVDVEDSRMIS